MIYSDIVRVTQQSSDSTTVLFSNGHTCVLPVSIDGLLIDQDVRIHINSLDVETDSDQSANPKAVLNELLRRS